LVWAAAGAAGAVVWAFAAKPASVAMPAIIVVASKRPRVIWYFIFDPSGQPAPAVADVLTPDPRLTFPSKSAVEAA
jgi:hypothetical protein